LENFYNARVERVGCVKGEKALKKCRADHGRMVARRRVCEARVSRKPKISETKDANRPMLGGVNLLLCLEAQINFDALSSAEIIVART
jgi:hypothetical protein